MAPSWVFPALTKSAAEEKVQNADGSYDDGTFLVRLRGEDTTQFVLTLVFRKRPTHHLIQSTPEQLLTINGKLFGEFLDLDQLITRLQESPPPPGWPVVLTTKIANESASGPKKPSLDGLIHPVISKKEAEAVLEERKLKAGIFLIRPRAADDPNALVLSLPFRGKCTHHLLQKKDEGFTVNGKLIEGATTFEEAIASLRVKSSSWPVSLHTLIAPGGREVPLSEIFDQAEAAPSSAPAVAPPNVTPEAARRQAQSDADELRAQKEEMERKARVEAEAAAAAEAERRRKAQEEEARLEEQQRAEERARLAAEEREREQRRAEAERQAREEEEEQRRAQQEQARLEEQRRAQEQARLEEQQRTLASQTQDTQQREHTELFERVRSNSRSLRRHQAESSDEEDEPPVSEAELKRRKKLEMVKAGRWKNGEEFDVHITRPNPGVPFGFGVARMWRIDGVLKVISWVDPDGPAAGQLEAEDVIIAVNGDSTEDLALEQLKDEIRALGNDFKARIFRPHDKRTGGGSDELPAQVNAPAPKSKGSTKGSKKKQKAKPNRVDPKHGDCCGSIWCHHQANMQKYMREEEETLKMIMKVTKRLGGQERLQVVMSPRARTAHSIQDTTV
eukprot:m.150021 g.150021  ORF g.150021 m.150021 type:complete len:619 (-) comp14218_c0_seq1:274-2130(-)